MAATAAVEEAMRCIAATEAVPVTASNRESDSEAKRRRQWSPTPTSQRIRVLAPLSSRCKALHRDPRSPHGQMCQAGGCTRALRVRALPRGCPALHSAPHRPLSCLGIPLCLPRHQERHRQPAHAAALQATGKLRRRTSLRLRTRRRMRHGRSRLQRAWRHARPACALAAARPILTPAPAALPTGVVARAQAPAQT